MADDFKLDFICIGAPKCATTWLAKTLNEHPDIFMPEKEPNFFNKTFFFYRKNAEWNYKKGINWYSRFFAGADSRIKGEKTPRYLYDQEAPKLIKKHFPNIKIILILRNPIDLVWSYYWHAKYKNNFPNINKMMNSKHELFELGYFSKYIKRYLQYFSRDQMLILFYDDLKADPQNFLYKVCDFLGVDNKIPLESANQEVNVTKNKLTWRRKYFFMLRNFSTRATKKYLIKFPNVHNKIRKCDNIIKNNFVYKQKTGKKHKPIPQKTRQKLLAIYQPEIKRLENILGSDLRHWET